MKPFILCAFAALCVFNVKAQRLDEDTAILLRQNFFPLFPFLGGLDFGELFKPSKQEAQDCASRVRNVRLTKLRNGRVYLFNIGDKVPWQQARQNCLQLGMYLATASTQEESNLLVEHVKQMFSVIGAASAAPTVDSFMWTGLNALQNPNGGWYWDSTGQATTFSHWASGQPVVANFCAGINKDVPAIPETSISGWATQDCADPRGYICELPRHCTKYVNAVSTPNDVYRN